MAKRVFISYRREDTGPAAGRVYDRLWRVLAKHNVFFDVSAIGGGEDFEKKIEAEIAKSDAVLIFIGDKWLEQVQHTGAIRIWEERDYVRAEVREALKRPVLVLPILVSGARMPRSDQLPEDVREITARNALLLRHESFDDDTENIVAAIRGVDTRERGWEKRSSALSQVIFSLCGLATAAILLILLAMIHYSYFDRPISASIGVPFTIILAVATLAFGAWVGLSQRRRRNAN